LGPNTVVKSRAGRGAKRGEYWGPIPTFTFYVRVNMDNQRRKEVPPGLERLIQLNVAYEVFICPQPECCKAVQPRAWWGHLHVQHHASLRDRERVQRFIESLNWDYDFSTIQLPEDGSRPQPIIPVIDGFECQNCKFKSSNRKRMKVHGNTEHNQQEASDNEVFREVRMQSWFQDHRQRYWRVGGADIGEDKSADANIDTEDTVEVIDVVAVRAFEEAEVFGEEEEEVVSAFDDSEDGDYRESSAEVAVRVVKPSPVRKRKRRSKDGEVDSESDVYQDSSPGFAGGVGATKRQKRIWEFRDSGVVMGSSQVSVRSSSPYSDIVPPSSPPVLESVGRDPLFPGPDTTEVDDRLITTGGDDGPNTTVVDDSKNGPSSPTSTAYRRSTQLRKRLERWCRQCPACCLAGDFQGDVHHKTGCWDLCWRDDTDEIIKQATAMQQHIEESGGFQGRGGCFRCGVPRTICQHWQVNARGDWEEVPGKCQYRGKLVPAVVTMMTNGSDEGWGVVECWMVRDGVMPTRPAEVFEWFRREKWWDDMEVEVAQIVRVFHMLTNKNEGA
jgi:hypothetical protein